MCAATIDVERTPFIDIGPQKARPCEWQKNCRRSDADAVTPLVLATANSGLMEMHQTKTSTHLMQTMLVRAGRRIRRPRFGMNGAAKPAIKPPITDLPCPPFMPPSWQ